MNSQELALAYAHLNQAIEALDRVGTLIDDSADHAFQQTREAIAIALFTIEKRIERGAK